MAHVTSETRTVYRAGRSWYRSRWGAYYNAAKQLVLDKYPPWLNRGDGSDVESTAADLGWPLDLAHRRAERAERLFFKSGNGYDDPYRYFDVARFQRFVRRVARFLMYVDRRPASPGRSEP